MLLFRGSSANICEKDPHAYKLQINCKLVYLSGQEQAFNIVLVIHKLICLQPENVRVPFCIHNK